MGSVSSDFSSSIAGQTIKLAELYRITLRTGQMYYFTSHSQNITWNGQTYWAYPLQRDPVQVNLQAEIDECKIYVACVASTYYKSTQFSYEPSVLNNSGIVGVTGGIDYERGQTVYVTETFKATQASFRCHWLTSATPTNGTMTLKIRQVTNLSGGNFTLGPVLGQGSWDFLAGNIYQTNTESESTTVTVELNNPVTLENGNVYALIMSMAPENEEVLRMVENGDGAAYTGGYSNPDWICSITDNGGTIYQATTRDCWFRLDGYVDRDPESRNVLSDLVAGHGLDNAEIEIVEIVRGSSYGSGQERPIFMGRCDIERNRQFLLITLRSWLSSLSIQCPRRMVQETCSWNLFESSWCNLAQASFSYVGEALTGTSNSLRDTTRGILYKAQFTDGGAHTIKKGDEIGGGTGGGTAIVVNVMYEDDLTGRLWYCELVGTQFVDAELVTATTGANVTISGSPIEDNIFYCRGEMRILTGDNAGDRRMIIIDQSSTLTFIPPMVYDVEASVSYAIYPGCDGRGPEVCHSWFSNDQSFSGHLYVPRVDETLL